MDKDLLLCIDQAYRYLSLREHNQKELITKLKQKNFEEDIISRTVKFLIDEGSLSEERYIKVFITSSNKRHPEGKSIVLQRLAQKGADRVLSKEIINNIYTYEYEQQLLSEAHKKLIKKGKNDDLRAQLIKLGFSSSAISEYLSNLME